MISTISAWIKKFFMEEMLNEVTDDQLEWMSRVDKCVRDCTMVKIFPTDDTGDSLYAVVDPSDPEYWLNAFESQDDAITWTNSIGVSHECVAHL